jgi:beta-mannanase
MTRHLTNDFFKGRVQQSQQPVVSLPMMPDSAAKQHAACATGAFDERFREFGRNLVAAGAGNAVVRLGWEANIGTDSHPWGIDSTREVPAFKSCFARLVGALKSTASNIKIEWSNAKRYDSTLPALTTCPGNAYVDIRGLHYYDRPPITSQAAWDREVNRYEKGHPVGIGAWVAEARRNGKRLAVPEWGVWESDNLFHIELMYKFFKANAGSISYENYFNTNVKHRIFPVNAFPNASARYQQLWSTAP